MAKPMKKIPATPFARLSLNDQQLFLLSVEPEAWPEHLLHAYQIANERLPQAAKQIVIDAVAAAHRAVSKAYETQLREERSSTLAAFCKACKKLSNATKPIRLRKAVRTQIDQAARAAFASGVADLETIQQFLSECNVARVRHLALDYEASPAQLHLECEGILIRLISGKAEFITAHDVFAALHGASLRCAEMARSKAEKNLLQDYLAEIDGIWTSYGLKVGRGNHPADGKYRGPFSEFAERVLLNQRKPGSNLFEPLSPLESANVWKEHWKMPAEERKATSARPFRDAGLITDRILRGYLDQRRPSKKSG